VNLCGQVRGFLQREKASRTKTKIHLILIKPCISFNTFKKNGGNPVHLRERNPFRDTEICPEVRDPRRKACLGGRGAQRQGCLLPSSFYGAQCPLKISNSSFTPREALRKSLCQLQLKIISYNKL